jgi:pimeloyl-ACP methyl ester carboxylesterase
MRRFGKVLGRGIVFLILAFLVFWAILPTDQVDREIALNDNALPDDLDAWLESNEQQFSDIIPGAAKRIVWAGQKGGKTPLAIVYLHGFSATAEEIRPVPDEVATALGANLYFTRLAGHGRGGAAMATATAGDWIEDTAEAMAIGRRLGEKVVLVGTSTGATLAALAATDPKLSQDLAGVVLISPNFGLRSAAAAILDLPLARYWGPLVAGAERSFVPANDDHARYWTTRYPTVALFPMAALVRHVRWLDFATAKVPALVIYAPKDQVIDPTLISPLFDRWGGPVKQHLREMAQGDDAYAHVIAGDILSPGQTDAVIALILDWAKGI